MSYAQTAQNVEKRAREEASKFQDKAHAAKEDAKDGLRKAEKKSPRLPTTPGGAVNLAILGGLGIAAYAQRDTIKT
ncbi:hypothetical protein OC834_007573 [Tilletia horrida]|uniref:Uncharacterized protein n=1 Tax=Tilletia horrida TaxID=155126 RepID=A0AAN6JGS4_9BASI|nr:hypothetical protein OC834_007573 [Tilletia horrida]KAK0519577.1 hypothetical protein OC842_007402 [Tilletia horrida]